jgi:hypothetical protein
LVPLETGWFLKSPPKERLVAAKSFRILLLLFLFILKIKHTWHTFSSIMATSVQCTNKNCHLIWSINSFSITPKNLMVGNKSVATIKNIKRCPTCGSSIKRIPPESKPKSHPKRDISSRRLIQLPKKKHKYFKST